MATCPLGTTDERRRPDPHARGQRRPGPAGAGRDRRRGDPVGGAGGADRLPLPAGRPPRSGSSPGARRHGGGGGPGPGGRARCAARADRPRRAVHGRAHVLDGGGRGARGGRPRARELSAPPPGPAGPPPHRPLRRPPRSPASSFRAPATRSGPPTSSRPRPQGSPARSRTTGSTGATTACGARTPRWPRSSGTGWPTGDRTALAELRRLARDGSLVLLTATKDLERSGVAVLAAVLGGR